MKIFRILFAPLCWICKKIYKDEAEVVKTDGLRDSLTGLYSTAYFSEKMEHEQARFGRYEAPFTLLFIKIDGLPDKPSGKEIKTWESALKKVGEIAFSELRTVDVVARYGATVLAALLPETKLLHARFVAERLRVNIKDATEAPAITVCIGVGEQLKDNSISNLIDRVKNSLDKAIENGSDKIGIASDNTGDAEFESEE